jgi:peptide/nickel transport system permease protein
MAGCVLQRLLFGALTVLGVSIAVFVSMRILAGDQLIANFGAGGDTTLSDEQRANYMVEIGLSDPLPLQHLHSVQDILRGDLGYSFFRSDSVAEMGLRRGPLIAQIAFLPVPLSRVVGIPVTIISVLFLAFPGFWLGMLLVLGLLFAFAYRTPLTGASPLTDPWTTLQMIIGPAILLGLGRAAHIARMARSSLFEVIREDYVRTARSKGLNVRAVISLHALPSMVLPIITLSRVLFGFVLAGSIGVLDRLCIAMTTVRRPA